MTILPNTILYNKRSFYLEKIKNSFKNHPKINKLFNKDIYSALERIFPRNIWLRPDGSNLKNMLNIVNYYSKNNSEYIEFMLHTSELMPGGSNRFTTIESIENLYKDLECLFKEISKNFIGVTLKEYYDIKVSNSKKE
jgi:hypothetical protein